MTALIFSCWKGCCCTDIDTIAGPERCPCHGGERLGTMPITVHQGARLGHRCDMARVAHGKKGKRRNVAAPKDESERTFTNEGHLRGNGDGPLPPDRSSTTKGG